MDVVSRVGLMLCYSFMFALNQCRFVFVFQWGFHIQRVFISSAPCTQTASMEDSWQNLVSDITGSGSKVAFRAPGINGCHFELLV